MNYPAYPTYKESGIAWLGAVPEHWEVKRGRFVMQVNPPAPRLRALKDVDEVSFIPMEAVNENGGFKTEQTKLKAECSSGYTEFQENDVVVAKITPCFENGKGSIATGLTNFVAYGTTELHVLRSRDCLDYRFLFYVTISDVFREIGKSEMYGAGGQKRVPPEFCKDFPIGVPPLSEQTAIADFLDRETGRIDTLIAKKRRLIGLLKEKRSALISRTVTRGLPADAAREFRLEPHTRYKDSGIEWLGDVPEGWILKAIKWETQVQRGASPRPIDDPVYFDDYGEYSWVRISDVTSAGMYLEQTEQRLSELGSSLSVKLQPGSLFLSIAGTVGKPCISRIKCCIHDGFVYFPKWKDESRYLFYIFASGEPYKGLGKMGTQLNLNTDTVGGIVIGIPTIEEQTAIANYLDRETAKIDKLIDKVEEAIERLQEYRTALITAAVTGKIDVRYAAERAVRYGLAAEEGEAYG
ncbi:restriction endonuclease subunit S [Prosthecochloris vibrioformis]|uniref:Restriction endonuclease subunit S n=1 Tax=Prosthecochloris vibrioformis TaxID=1098 RepID=A0A5C4RXV5_PROVB|nr:restriction endonuclease subunit S [Prosthecochloris vibrioformis]TNJ35930.1 restriction endonuclease subunit S [Prosthecochloris vibrioformis]